MDSEPKYMIGDLYNIVSQISSGIWLILGIGIGLVILGGYNLYLELRAVLSDEPSPATFSDDPKALNLGRRTMSWIFIIFALVVGFAFLYAAYVNIHTCVIVDRPEVSC